MNEKQKRVVERINNMQDTLQTYSDFMGRYAKEYAESQEDYIICELLQDLNNMQTRLGIDLFIKDVLRAKPDAQDR